MVAYLRQLLVMLLILLQMAAPLMHAHVGADASPRGLHLHEFEALHIERDGPVLMAFDHDLQMQSSIVNIGSAIKQQQLLDKLSPAVFLFVLAVPVFAVARQIGIVNFSPHISLFVPEPLPSQNASRAPPF